MEKSALYHRPESEYAYLYNKDTVHLRFRSKKDDLKQIVLHYDDSCLFYERGYAYQFEMVKIATTEEHDYWQAEIQFPYRRLQYIFKIIDCSNKSFLYGDRGLIDDNEKNYHLFYHGFKIPFFHKIDMVEVPQWVQDTVWYQIFPERFYNGDDSLSPANKKEWDYHNLPGNSDFYGGDLKGVLDKLDYLQELGITGIYFCPIFESPSNHKYDTVNYYEIDKHFGDKELFKKLVEEAHRRGMKIMLDAVFNHIGDNSPQWQDVLEKGEKSLYKDWFHIHSFPIQKIDKWYPDIHERLNYDAFAFQPHMPKLNTANPEVKEYLIGIATYWAKEFDIDAWRLDVANEIDHQFWRDFRKAVKTINPSLYILGEVWHSSQPWLNGDEFDAVMNYPLAESLQAYFVRDELTTREFISSIHSQKMLYRKQTNQVLFNLLDSHDTERLLTTAQGDKDKVKQALAALFLQEGTPCIYYGTEVGMEGGADPDCRRVMIWDEKFQDQDMIKFIKEIVSLRKSIADLIKKGNISLKVTENDLLKIILSGESEELVGVFNKTGQSFLVDISKNILFGNRYNKGKLEDKGFIIYKIKKI
ncbi:glycoside hydrolase family 13 protein [Streptococcus sp. S784/96/1]|uniref:glycoside hydrolase family 13 protein n=1 Tax=Streptococcus sp. S784/96/1 TaxID=2653499 RepID=UPI0013870224|nr:glycoside hydrolase family 13 protein [Streptococcus sp. S784/96/1]